MAQSREGIYNCKKSDRCLLFVNLNKDSAKESLKFDDHFQGEVFHWDSQPKQSFGVPSIQAMVNGDKEVHLFARIYPKIKSKTQPYIYCGSLTYGYHDETTSRPVHLMFRADDMRYDLPEDHPLSRIYHWKPSHEGQQSTYGPTVEVEKKKDESVTTNRPPRRSELVWSLRVGQGYYRLLREKWQDTCPVT